MKYDDAEIYMDCEVEVDDIGLLSGTHIGFYLAWAVKTGLLANRLSADAEAVLQDPTHARALLFDRCDGKLMSEDMNERGNAFTQDYYDARYISDYVALFALNTDDPVALFTVDNTAANYAKVAQWLDARFGEWQNQAALPSDVKLLQLMEAQFAPWLLSQGFIRDPNAFYKKKARYIKTGPWGQHCLMLSALDDRPKMYGMALEVSSTFNTLAKWVSDEMRIDNPRITSEPPATYYQPRHHWLGDWPVPLIPFRGRPVHAIPLTDVRQIEPAIGILCRRAQKVLPGLLASLETLEGYDQLYCGDPARVPEPWRVKTYNEGPFVSVSYLTLLRLLCAELAHHPNLRAMCDDAERALAAAEPALRKQMFGAEVQEMRARLMRLRARMLSR
ncbi:MAG TPA: hypothetical protein PLB25_14575 [Rhodoferax sp.]|nr:hypothetical protein [Rhodoferax sp.]